MHIVCYMYVLHIISYHITSYHISGLERALIDSRSLRLDELCIIPGKQCWIVHVDATVLDSGGNLLDAIVLASRAALKTTTIPAVTVVSSGDGGGDGSSGGDGGSGGAELEIEVSDDPFESKPLSSADEVPVTVTLTKV